MSSLSSLSFLSCTLLTAHFHISHQAGLALGIPKDENG
jgi:hypothetical protein